MNGGLGNQLYQYVFARWLEETLHEPVIINDMVFSMLESRVEANKNRQDASPDLYGIHNGYEIDYVFPYSKKLLFMSNYFDQDVWEYLVKKAGISRGGVEVVAQAILDSGIDLTMMIEVASDHLRAYTGKKYYTPSNSYNSDMARIPGSVYYHGNWINQGWFNAYREIFLEELTFRSMLDERNLEYERLIRESFAVGVHVRRGDFVRLKRNVSEDTYRNTITELREKIPDDARFFVFSNEMSWCKENLESLGLREDETVFVEGNFDYRNNYIDMQLMSVCNVLVAAGNSTFSYFASILNKEPDFYVLQSRGSSTRDIAVMNDPQAMRNLQANLEHMTKTNEK